MITKEQVHKVITWFIRLTLLAAIVTSAYQQNILTFLVSTLTLILTFVPEYVESKYDIKLPTEFELFVVLFIYGSLYLGEIHGYYDQFWWWDALLHLGSAVALGFVGFAAMLILDKTSHISASPRALAFFGFCFALAMGTIWELFEFFMDQVFGLYMQKGLVDTMGDFVADAVGALLANIIGYYYLKSQKRLLLSGVITDFISDNPRIFRKN